MTPFPATGGPVVVMGGQPTAHAPEQVDCEEVSASKRYRLLPSGPTRNVPRPVLAVPTVTGWAPEGLIDAVVLAEVELFEQAAASRPMATTTTITFPILELTMSSSTLAGDIASDPGTTVGGGREIARRGGVPELRSRPFVAGGWHSGRCLPHR